MNLIAWPVLLPLVAGSLLLFARGPGLRAALSVGAAALTLAVEVAILLRFLDEGVLSVQMASWPAPFGISLVVDGLSALMLVLSGITGLLTVFYASSSLQTPPRYGQGTLLNRARESFGAQALFQFLFMGVNMSFLTGDLFNLFVAFEVMLVASYGLLLLGGELPQLREGLKYVVINLLSSAMFVIAAGLSYGLFGTLNMADISQRVAANGGDPRVTAVAALLALVFAVKAAAFPLGFWLPNSYPVPSGAVSAFFAAVLTKVGVYALIRIFTLLFPEEGGLQSLVLALAALTLLFGATAAITSRRWRYLLSFANVASIGYLLAGAFSGTGPGLAAALYYLINSVLVIFALFLLAALAEAVSGTSIESKGHLAIYPWLGGGFFVAMLALAGIPPTSGFIAKFGLVGALLERGGLLASVSAFVAILGSLLLVMAGVFIWRGFFWGDSDAVHSVAIPRPMSVTAGAAVTLVVALAVFAGPIYSFSADVAGQLEGNSDYLQSVLVPAGEGRSEP